MVVIPIENISLFVCYKVCAMQMIHVSLLCSMTTENIHVYAD